MARLLGFLLLVILVVLGLSFAVLNSQPVALNFYFGSRDIPLSMIVVVSLAAGAVTGVLFSLGTIVRLKHRTGSLHRRLRAAQKEADQARILP
jgi:putative membrane protein